MRTSLLAGASRFAQFSGIGRGRRAEDDDRRDDETGARKGRRSRAEDDDDHEDDDTSSKRSKGRADDGDDDRRDDDTSSKRSKGRADDGDDEPRDDEDKSSKRSSKARADDDKDDDYCEDDDDNKSSKRSRARADDDDDGDDDKDEMSGRSAAANARRRERARCAAIFEHPAAEANVELAASLAFDTTLTRREAIAVLKRQAGRGGGEAHAVRDRDERRGRNPDLGPGGGLEAPTGTKAASLWEKAIDKAVRKPR